VKAKDNNKGREQVCIDGFFNKANEVGCCHAGIFGYFS
jgi:hypothetical protein